MRLLELFGSALLAWVMFFVAMIVAGAICRAFYEAFMIGWGVL